MSINEIIFFTNPQSKKCFELHQLITQYKIPAKYFSVTSKNIADILSKGKYFKIKGVPSLVVAFDDGNIKKFEGDHCIEFIKYMVSEMNTNEDEEDEIFNQSEEELSEGEDDNFDVIDDDEPPSKQSKELYADSGKLNIEEAMKRAEEERNRFDEQLDPKLRRQKKT